MTHKIDSKTARAKLAHRREPYWSRIERGTYVGYRVSKLAGEGTWIGRYRDDEGDHKYRSLGAIADDSRGTAYDKAVREVRQWAAGLAAGVANELFTVADAVQAYTKDQAASGRTKAAETSEKRYRRHVLGDEIAKIELSKLRRAHVLGWMARRVKPRNPEDPESVRAAKNTANREFAALRAALNFALREGMVANNVAWSGDIRFEDVEGTRDIFLSHDQQVRLIAACPAPLGKIVRLILLTGLRPGEAAKMKVADFNQEKGLLRVGKDNKTGARTFAVSTEARELIASITKDRLGLAPLCDNGFGTFWDTDEAAKEFRTIADSSGMPEGTVLYSLRHTFISEAMPHMEVAVIAKICGTSIEMIMKHYGHLGEQQTRADLDRVRAEVIPIKKN